MKHIRWQFLLGLALVVLSAIIYVFHFYLFRDPHHIFIYFVGDVAFVPIEVLLVTLIIHRLMSQREKRARLEKLNMVIGTFFSEMGTRFLTYLSDFDPDLDKIRGDLIIKGDWSDDKFGTVMRQLRTYEYGVDITKVDLEHLRSFLLEKRDFLMRLLENPSILEHETFTRLLRAVFHLTEELECREDVRHLPDSDHHHIAGDIKRAYAQIVREWLDYMKYLKSDYPYLFSLAMRLNPFDLEASPIVK